MGNTSTKESRSGNSAQQPGHPYSNASDLTPSSSHADRPTSRRNRVSRADLGGILGIGSSGGPSSRPEPPYERRETKQEREARRLEKERITRVKERERSIREEHVDGGYLVTLGTYTGPEDFSKHIVRQLQIERKLAPFWRGLNDFDDRWTEHQIIAAARGLPIPPADKTPPDELIPRLPSAESPSISAQNVQNLTVPIEGKSQSATSEHSASNATSPLTSPISIGPIRASPPFKPRGKALAAVLGGGTSRNGSTTEIVPREISLPHDPFVNGQPLEVFLYKDATECPICFLTYPPYLNHTRCCDQAICSECFVQIKRPDPHYPEGHNENDPNHDPEETAGKLISEPACCPYCTQPEFGVTYDPPPFRRGLAYSSPLSNLGSMHTAMSSSSSLNSTAVSPTPASPTTPSAGRRRNQSLSAHSPNVILTDRVRPDWSTKLQAARNHQARRAAAATALHTAAFLMGTSETRPFRVSRFGRRNNGGSTPSGGDPSDVPAGGSDVTSHPGQDPGQQPSPARAFLAAGGGGGGGRGGDRNSNRNSRMEDLEDMMFMEAVRLSLAAEEERKRKAEKEERKEAKKREKEERKAAKAAAKHGQGPYGSGDGRSGQSSASGSSLSLSSLGLNRKRGNSGAGNLRAEASVANAMASSSESQSPTPATTSPAAPGTTPGAAKDKGKAIDRGSWDIPEDSGDVASDSSGTPASPTSHPSPPRPTHPPHQPAGPSHLRQMSNASSVSSSVPDSQPGSFVPTSHLQDPRASGHSLGGRSGASEGGGDHGGDRDPSSSPEPMFNFSSLAEVVGVTLEGENAGRRVSRVEADKEGGNAGVAESSPVKEADEVSQVVSAEHIEGVRDESGKPSGGNSGPGRMVTSDGGPHATSSPEVTITPGTPVLPHDDGDDDDDQGTKQIAHETMVKRVHPATQ